MANFPGGALNDQKLTTPHCRANATNARLTASILLCATVAGLTGCEKPPAPPAPPPPEVYVAKPESRVLQDYDDFTGQIEAVASVDLRARVTGQVTERPFTQGAIVRQGDVLYRIDDKPFKAELARAQGLVNQAKAQLKLTEVLFERAKSLIDTKAISQQDYDQREQDVAVARASVSTAEAAAETARLNVEYTTVVAPLTGRASKAMVDPGNMVDGGKGDGTLLTNISQLAPVYCYFDVDERSFVQFFGRVGAGRAFDPLTDIGRLPVAVGLTGAIDYPFKGSVDFVDNKVDRTTGTIRVRAILENADGRLLPGMFARVRVPKGDAKPTLVIPELALNKDQGQTFVMVLGKARHKNDKGEEVGEPYDTPTYRPVVPGRSEDGLVAVAGGVGPEDRIVVSGLLQALQSMGRHAEVKAIDATTTAATRPGFPQPPAAPPAAATAEPEKK
jgi:membrane fusion protein, multidrug efflux system